MTRILLTGATGYVGGQVLHTLTETQSNDVQIVALVRDQAKVKQLEELYPNIKTILGDLDNTELVQAEAEASDIVLHLAATGHVPSATAIAQGLQERHRKTQKTSYWVQISGATCFATHEIAKSHFGYATDDTYDDLSDQSRILSILRNNPKRVVENTVLKQLPTTVRTALVIGPLIYGVGQGPMNQRSIQAPEIAKATLGLGHAFKLGDGENIWSNIHVRDLAGSISLLVSAAIEEKEGLWNDDGVYNVENGAITFKALDAAIANEAHKQGLIEQNADTKMETIDAAKADSLSGHAAILWGTNARTKASRARKLLGWEPSNDSLEATLADLVRKEAGASKR